MNRAARIAKGLGALLGLTLLVVGVPIGLLAAGQGPAVHLGGIRSVRDGLVRAVSDSTLVRIVALACWVVWLLLVMAVALELLSAVRSSAGRAKAAVRIPAFQGVANALVVGALLLLPQRAIASTATVSRGPAAAQAASAPAAPLRHRPEAPSPHVPVPASRAAAGRTVPYVVRRYDSPWGIAERHLGDGTRWRELRDGHGRSLVIVSEVSDSGGGGTRPQARVIRPGEVLYLPASAAGPEAVAPTDGTARSHPSGLHQVVPLPPAGPAPAPTHRAIAAAAVSVPAEARPSAAPSPAATPAPVEPSPADTTAAAPSPAATPAPPATPPAGTTAPAAPRTDTAQPPTGPAAAPPRAAATQGTASSPDRRRQPGLDTSESPPKPAPASSSASPSSPAASQTPDDSSPPLLTAEPAGPARSPATVPPSSIVKAKGQGHPRGSSSTTLVEAGLLSAGVLATVEALRRRQAQHRPAGRRLRLPTRRLAAAELAIRIGAKSGQVDLINLAVHRLVDDLRRSQLAVPSVLAIVAGTSSLEVLIDRPSQPPTPWTATSQGFRWRIDAAQLRSPSSSGSAPLPGLVPVGRAGPDGHEVLLNLEAAGVLSVTGEPGASDALVRAMATSLSGLRWADAVNLILVGFGSELEAVAHVRSVVSIAPVRDELRSTAQLMRDTIGDRDPFGTRVDRPDGDGWAPTIVCCAGAVEPAERDEVVRLATTGSGVVAVISGRCVPGSWTVDVDGRPITIQPLRLAVEPTLLGAHELEQIGDLYRVAMDEAGATSADAPYGDLAITVDRPPPTLAERLPPLETVSVDVAPQGPDGPAPHRNGNGSSAPAVGSPDHPIRVAILGTVEIEGANVFKRAKSRELAVYLALHPSGVGEAELDEALWPSANGRVVAASTRDSTVSVARTALGGPTRLLPAQGHGREKRYQLSDDVGTDWSLFCRFHRAGREAEDPSLLRTALQLVRGRPFEGVIAGRSYGWVHTEGHARHIEAEVADAADLAASLLLARGDAIGARWAARQGLMADPFVERLWVRLMEGADQLGDSQEVERIMDEMDVVLDLQGDFSGLHPHTLDAYDRLSRRRRLPR